MYPFIETHTVWGKIFKFNIVDQVSDNWYGLKKYQSPELENHCYELEGMRALVKEGDVVLDCGAHYGFYSMVYSLCVGLSGAVISIEAERDAYQQLIENRQLNIGFAQNVLPYHKAISNINDETVYISGNHLCRIGEPVSTIKLDMFCSFEPTVVKVDIEGCEVAALEGAIELLKMRPSWEVSIHLQGIGSGADLRNYGYSSSQIIEIFRDNGYNLYSFENGSFIPHQGEITKTCTVYALPQ